MLEQKTPHNNPVGADWRKRSVLWQKLLAAAHLNRYAAFSYRWGSDRGVIVGSQV